MELSFHGLTVSVPDADIARRSRRCSRQGWWVLWWRCRSR
jgi:hypothetical protein